MSYPLSRKKKRKRTVSYGLTHAAKLDCDGPVEYFRIKRMPSDKLSGILLWIGACLRGLFNLLFLSKKEVILFFF